MMIERLAELRKEHEWTQVYLAYQLHVSQRVYSHYEKGTHHLPVETLVELSKIYHVSTDYILGLTDVEKIYPPSKSAANNSADPDPEQDSQTL